MKKKLLSFTLLLILLNSCNSTVFKNYEHCTILSDSVICTDERVKEPPQDCTAYNENEHAYTCPIDYLFGYSATNIADFTHMKTKALDLEKERNSLLRALNQCQNN